jgi:NTE family protein
MRAFVLGGGGARGALQVGALRALAEAGVQPDLLVGTSAGGINATYLAMYGLSPESIDGLESAWCDAAEADLLPNNYMWLVIRSLFNRGGSPAEHRLRDFFVEHGAQPDVQFGQLQHAPLILVATDLKSQGTALFGSNPQDSVLQALLASTALPPYVRPLSHDEQLLIDGGAVCNLPIEPALCSGATEIIALDVTTSHAVLPAGGGMGPMLYQLIHTVQQRQTFLEKQLAAARKVPIHHVQLESDSPVAVWEFQRAASLFRPGYDQMRRYLAEHPELNSHPQRRSRLWWQRLRPGGFLPPRHQFIRDS